MARIAGVNIPQNKVVHIALTYIHGIGNFNSKIICKKYSEKIPQKINHLKLLPGIGDNTASIIMAVVNNKPYIAFDGNVKRVFSRLLNKNIEKYVQNGNKSNSKLPNSNRYLYLC